MGERLFDTVDRLNSEFVSFWLKLANIESPTDYKQGIDAVGRLFSEFAKKRNWYVEVVPRDAAGDTVCITMNRESQNRPITLSGHLDTVHPVGSFGNPAAKIKDGIIYGPGVMDCKGGTVAALLAMTALDEIGFRSRPIQLILQTDEEESSMPSNKATIAYMCRKAENSLAFLNCESIRGNTAVLWRKGICRYEFSVTGKTIHAYRCVEGASAVREAAYKIIELEKMKDADGVTCNCGFIEGGTAANTVPEKCKFIAEIRSNNNEEWKKAEEAVYKTAQTAFVNGTSCTVSKQCSRPAMEKTERNFKLLKRMNEIYEKTRLPALTARQSLGGSDAAEITCAGIPCVDSIGVAGDKIHTRDEYAIVSSLAEAAKRIAAVCMYLQN